MIRNRGGDILCCGSAVSRDQLFRRLRECFSDAGLETPDLDARLLVCHCGGFSFEDLVLNPGASVEPDALARVGAFAERRLAGEPISRIVGVRGFWQHDFSLNSDTLDPRADTETLVEAALLVLKQNMTESDRPVIVDAGTGSGCILVSLLAEFPKAFGIGVDISHQALQMARENADQAGVSSRASFVCGDWLNCLSGGVDLFVSNPPYIPSDDIAGLAPEVRLHDPLRALDGGESGLEAYRTIIPMAKSVVKPGGAVLFEVGAGQAGDVQSLLARSGFVGADQMCEGLPTKDLGGHVRVVAGWQL